METEDMPTVEEAVRGYISLREKKRELAQKQADEMRPLNEAMATIEAWLQRMLLKERASSIRTGSGTAVLKKHSRWTVRDRDAYLEFVFAQRRFDLLESRVSKSAAEDYLESTGEVPPGCDVEVSQVVHVVRR